MITIVIKVAYRYVKYCNTYSVKNLVFYMNKGLREDKSYVAAHSVAVARHHATGLGGGVDII